MSNLRNASCLGVSDVSEQRARAHWLLTAEQLTSVRQTCGTISSALDADVLIRNFAVTRGRAYE